MNVRMKKVISFFLVLFLITTSQSISTYASEYVSNQEQDKGYLVTTIDATYENPIYASNSESGIISSDEDITPTSYEEYEYYTYSVDNTSYDAYITDYDTAVSKLRTAMVNRTDTAFSLRTTVSDVSGLTEDIFYDAMEETDNPNEGDYLGYQWGTYNSHISYYYQSPYFYLNITYSMEYYTTAAQEKVVDTKVQQVLDSFNFTSSTSRYQKIKSIYDYICSNVTYDFDTLYNDAYDLKYTAYAALINKTAVCQGYAVLLYRMLREEGINTRVVTGGNHAWNIIQLGKYYFADSTWDAGMSPDYYYYFLVGDRLLEDHTLEAEFTSSDFTSRYDISADDYTYGETKLSINSVTLDKTSYTATGGYIYPSITVKDIYGQTLSAGSEYTVTYTNNIYPGTAKLTVTGTGEYTGTISKTFTITLGTVSLSNAESTSTGITVNWKYLSGVSGYYVYRRASNSSAWTKIATISSATTLSYTDTTAVAGTTYYYTVKGYYGSINGGYNSTGIKAVKLGQPTVSSVTNTASGPKVTWTKVAGATGYYVYRKFSTMWIKIGTISSGDTLSFTDEIASSGFTYTYSVCAISDDIVGTYNYTGKTIVSLDQPEVVSISNTNSGVKVGWFISPGCDGYYLYRKAAGSSTWVRIANITDETTLTYLDKTAVAGTSYTYTVKSYCGSYVSSFKSSGKTTKRLTQPNISSVVNAASGTTVKWSKTTGASGYYLYRKVAGTSSWSRIAAITSGSTLTYTDKTAKAGTTYNYTVKAYSGSYVSSYSNTGKTLKRLTQPGLSSVTNTSSGVKVNWTKTTGASGYYVYRKVSGGSWSKIATITSGSTVTYTDKTAKTGTTYIYTVKAYSGSYVSSFNAGKSVKRLTQPNYSLKNVSNGIKVSWSKITGASGYYVYRKTSGTSWVKIGTVKSGSTVTFTDKTAVKGKTYTYTVKAYSGSYVSSYNSGKSIKKL